MHKLLNQVVPFVTSSTLINYKVKGLTTFDYTINLSNTEKFGRVTYKNKRVL